MNEKVKEFLERKEQEKKERLAKERDDTLIRLGIKKKVFTTQKEYSKEYPYYDSKTQQRYGFVAEEITDEEYEQIKEYISDQQSERNGIVGILNFIGWMVLLAGLIVGMKLSEETPLPLIISFASSFVSAMMLFSFAEIIKLLQAIKNKK